MHKRVITLIGIFIGIIIKLTMKAKKVILEDSEEMDSEDMHI